MQIGALEIQLAADLARLRADMEAVKGTVGAAMQEVSRASERTTKAIGGALEMLRGLAAAVGIGWSVKGLIDTADAVTQLNNSLKLATGGARSAAVAYEQLFKIAQSSRTSFLDLGSTFASISGATQSLGLSQQRLLVVTEAIGNSMTISGGSAAGMQAALQQLGQGLAAGALRGDEFNSVMEQAPRLAQAMADGLGVGRGELRSLAEQGALTAEKVIGALEKSAPQLAKEVQTATMTVGQAMTMLGNSATKFVGEVDSATGASTKLAEAMKSLSGAIDAAGTALNEHKVAFGIIGGTLAGTAVVGSVARLSSAIGGVAGAVGAIGTAVGALGTAIVAHPAVAALLGLGALTGGLIAGRSAVGSTLSGMAGEIDDLTRRIAEAQKQLDNTAERGDVTSRLEERLKAMLARRAELHINYQQQLYGSGAGAGRGEAQYEAYLAQQAKDEQNTKRLTELRMQLDGVDSGYIAKVKELIELRQAGAIGDAEYDRRLGQLQKQVHKLSDEEQDAIAISAARAAAGIADAKSLEAAVVAGIARQAQALETQHEVGLVGDREYYEKRRQLAEQEGQAKVAALQAERALLAQQKIASTDDAELQRARIEQRQKLADIERQIGTARANAADEQTRLDYQEAEASAHRTHAGDQQLDQLTQAIRTQREHNEEIGKEGLALALVRDARTRANIARDEEWLAIQRTNKDATPEYLANLQREIELKKDLADQVLQGAYKQADADALRALNDGLRTAIDQAGQSLTDSLMRGGKGAGKQLEDYFKTLTFRVAVQAFFVQPLQSALGLTQGSAGAAGGSGGLNFNNIGSLASAASLIQKGFSSLGTLFGAGPGSLISQAGAYISQLGGAMGSSTVTQFGTGMAQGSMTIEGAGGAMGAGSAFASTMSSVGVPLMAAYIGRAVGQAISGGYSALGSSGNALVNLLGVGGGVVNRAFGRKLAGSGFEGTISDSGFEGNSFQFYKGGWFRSDKTTRGAMDPGLDGALDYAIQTIQAKNKEYAAALGLSADALKGVTSQIKIDTRGLSTEQVQQKIGEALDAANEILAERLLGANSPYSRLGESAGQTLARLTDSITAVNAAFTTLGTTLLQTSLQGAATAQQIADAFGGTSNFTSAVGAYFNAIYSDSDKLGIAQKNLSASFTAMGQSVPATAAAYRQLVEAQDLNTEAGRLTYASLVQLAPAYAEVRKALDDQAKTAADAAQALAEEAAQRAAAVAQQRAGLEQQLMQLTGDTAGLRARELAELDESNRALMQRIYALQDEQAAEQAAMQVRQEAEQAAAQARQEAEQAAAAVLQQRLSLESQLLQLQGNTAELRRRELDALDPSLRALQERIYALQDEQAAAQSAQQLRDAWRSLGETMADEVRRIRGLLTSSAPAGGYEALQAQFAVTTAQARAGDQDAAKLLASLSQSLLEAAGNSVSSATDMARIQAMTAASLAETMRQLSGRGVQVPAFANGGDHAGGWALVGEEGPELVRLPRARIFNARQTSQMLRGAGGIDTSRLEARVEQLTRQVAELSTSAQATRYAAESIARHTAETKRLLRDVTNNGEAMQTEVVT